MTLLYIHYAAGNYMFKVRIEALEKGVKHVQS